MNWRVVIQPSGHYFSVNENETVLEAALKEGLVLPYGCRNGTCGTCKCRIEGQVRCRGAALSEEEAAQGWTLPCQAVPLSNLTIHIEHIRSAGDIPVRKMPVKVFRKELLAHDVMRLLLKPSGGQRLQFLAGQYIEILLNDGKRRAFSIANAPHDDEFIELHIRNWEGGAFSSKVFSELAEKSILRLEGPFGLFCFRDQSPRPMIFVAGGTGFAPIKGIIEHALSRGVERPIHLYWGARDKEGLYLRELAESWARDHANVHYVPVLSQPLATDGWTGRVGYVHEAVLADGHDLPAFDVYSAGPPAMVKATHDAFLANGLDSAQFYSDPFDYAQD